MQPQPGDNLRLTIDLDLQRAAEKALRFGIQTAHDASEPYADGGAIVALDPNDGSVLAMASYPTYQPSVYVGRPDLKKLAPLLDPKAAAKANYPGLNRAIDASYPPGSTFKPVTALAAMQEHLVTPVRADPVHARRSRPYKQIVRQLDAADRHGHESADGARRVVRHVLLRARQALLHAAAEPRPSAAGLGEPLRVRRADRDRHQARDERPDPDARVAQDELHRGERYGVIDRIWKPGYSIQMAIGQGRSCVTPLQMARLYAMIANGGKLVTPHLAEDVEQAARHRPDARACCGASAASSREPTGVDPTALQFVREGLLEATQSKVGTSYGVFGNFPVSISGKTGTAEKPTNVPGYPAPARPEPVLVVRLRPDRHADDRRLRRDRERRPRRHLGGAGGAQGVRAVLRQAGHHDRAPLATEATDGDRDQSTHARRGFRPRQEAATIGALLRRLDWILLAGARRDGRVRPRRDRRDHAARRRAARRCTGRRSTRASARCSSASSLLDRPRPLPAAPGGRSTAGRSA